jgi:hypothetical protein
LAFVNVPPFITLKMPFNFVLGRLLHCGVATTYASFAGFLRPGSRAF